MQGTPLCPGTKVLPEGEPERGSSKKARNSGLSGGQCSLIPAFPPSSCNSTQSMNESWAAQSSGAEPAVHLACPRSPRPPAAGAALPAGAVRGRGLRWQRRGLRPPAPN